MFSGDVFNDSLWDIWFNETLLQEWCRCMMWMYAHHPVHHEKIDRRLKRWIKYDLSNIPHSQFNPKDYGYIYETPDGVAVNVRKRGLV